MANIVIPFLAYELRVEGRRPVDWFVEERGRNLLANERRWLEAQQRSWLSVWEVTSVDPGHGMDLKDFLTGEVRSIMEVGGSKVLTPHLGILARVVDWMGRACAAEPIPGRCPQRTRPESWPAFGPSWAQRSWFRPNGFANIRRTFLRPGIWPCVRWIRARRRF